MAPPHPLYWVPAEHEKKFLYSVLSLLFLSMTGLGIADHHLQNEVTPLGIVSFQMVGNVAEAQRALSAWGESGRMFAAFSLGMDYLFLVANALLFAYLAGLVGRKAEGRLPVIASLSAWVAWLFIVAGVFDSIENAAFLVVLAGSSENLWPCLGTLFALLKFLLIGLGVLYLLAGSCLCTLNKNNPNR